MAVSNSFGSTGFGTNMLNPADKARVRSSTRTHEVNATVEICFPFSAALILDSRKWPEPATQLSCWGQFRGVAKKPLLAHQVDFENSRGWGALYRSSGPEIQTYSANPPGNCDISVFLASHSRLAVHALTQMLRNYYLTKS